MMTSLTGKRNKWRLAFNTCAAIFFLIVISGILSPIFFPISHTSKNALMKAAKTQMKTFGAVLEMYRHDTGQFPNGLVDLMVRPAAATNWTQYMEAIPIDPWGHPYIYIFPGEKDSNTFGLSSAGPDGRLGTKDDIVYQP
jgi:general secretion pathway protein G